MLGGLGGAAVAYLYIDAGYLIPEYSAAMNAFFGEPGALNLEAIREEAQASKVYYYDCVDEIARSDESPKTLAQRIAVQDAELARIRRLPRFHVREGVIRGEGKRKRRQKKIDVQLAVDMLMHRVNGVVSRAVLIAGDLDFLPVVDSLVQLGVNVAVWHGDNAAEDLLAGADEERRLTLADFYTWSSAAFKATHRIPVTQVTGEGEPGGTVLRTGLWRNRRVRVMFDRSNPRHRRLWADATPGESSFVVVFDADDDVKLIEYFRACYGDVRWLPEGADGPTR